MENQTNQETDATDIAGVTTGPVNATREHMNGSAAWAEPVERLRANEAPDRATAANVEGRQVNSPLQGFGRLWQRTYRVRLAGVQATPAEVMATWKANFPRFQPEENRFIPTNDGVKPGALFYIDSNLVNSPGMDKVTPMASGVMVIYADDVSFTVMTPEGFPVSGWNTFSTYEEDGVTIAQVQGLERATDPIYEFGYRYMGGEKKQDRTWTHVLRSLAAHYGVQAEVEMAKTCVDPKLQWKQAGNVWHNAAIRTFFYKLTDPVRRMVQRSPAQ
jgi:hypothetical protein